MVGRSKPQKKMERKPSVDINIAENTYLKAKNLELAKAVADSKAAYTMIVEDRDMLQRELFAMNLRCTKLENFIKNMESASRGCMSSIVMASNHATELLQNAHNALRLNLGDDNVHTSVRSSMFNGSAHSSPTSNKTQAVNPMIGGHVILRPTINLRRVNEIPIEEIQRLQSGSQNLNVNRSSLENISPNRRQPVEAVMEPFINNEADDEYTDQTSEISDAASERNNGLDTVQEEQEDELEHTLTSENHLNSLGGASNTSLNLRGSGSQVPLLSGVFRDVRVYLSPMQNVAQYLDPRQHVTTERGSNKTHKQKRSHSMHSPRSSENVPRSSSNSGENRKLLATNINSNNTSQNQMNSTATSASLEDSFTTTLQNSLLSSTRIASPNHMHTSTSKPEDLNWMGVSSKCRNSPQTRTTLFSESNAFNNVRNSNYLAMKQVNTENRNSSMTPDVSRLSYSPSNRKSMPSTSNVDPLEGPSNLLDSVDYETKNKIETMSGLGLTPTFLDSSKSTSDPTTSPARTVLQRRERRKSDEKVKKSLYVTKRSATEKKKTSVVSTKVAKVLVKRLSTSKVRHSGSPSIRNSLSPRKSLNDSQRRLSLNSSPKQRSNQDEDYILSSNIFSDSSGSVASSRGRSSRKEKPPPKKRSRKAKQELPESDQIKKSNSSDSPRKRGRPKRSTAQASLKEPSLRKKLRRSK